MQIDSCILIFGPFLQILTITLSTLLSLPLTSQSAGHHGVFYSAPNDNILYKLTRKICP